MAWIESHQQLARHPKMLALAAELRISRPTAVGHLHYLWWWALDYAEDGDLTPYDDRTIAGAAEWPKKPETFVTALINSGWVNGDRSLHDWMDYAGRLVSRRRANAERMRSARATHSAPHDATHVDSTSRARAGATVPDLTQPTEPTVPTEQNRTEPNPEIYAADAASMAEGEKIKAFLADLAPPGVPNGQVYVKAPPGVSDTQAAFVRKLGGEDHWWPAIHKAKKRHDAAVVTTALSHIADSPPVDITNPYALLEAECQAVEQAVTS